MQSLHILKIGGKILEDEEKLKTALKEFAAIKSPKILVHGGGKKANELCPKLGIKPKMIDGRRITDAATLEVVTMVYAGTLNKKVVSILQSFNCNALGLTGADGNAILARKRRVKEIDYGFAGDVKMVNKRLIISLLSAGVVPVFCSITHDKNGQLLNTNADTIATELAAALADDFELNLTFHFEKKGVLTNPEDEESFLSNLDKEAYQTYKKTGVISNGMIPKIDNAFYAKNCGVKKVLIAKTEIL